MNPKPASLFLRANAAVIHHAPERVFAGFASEGPKPILLHLQFARHQLRDSRGALETSTGALEPLQAHLKTLRVSTVSTVD
jgi:hypothetical protein